jgi:hypothetical protein
MANLNVSALSEDILAAPGNSDANYIIVSVTDQDGKPVDKLDVHDFIIKVIVAPDGGRISHDIKVVESDFPGVYVVEVVPIENETWRKGAYVFAVGVHRKFDRGQAIVSVDVD